MTASRRLPGGRTGSRSKRSSSDARAPRVAPTSTSGGDRVQVTPERDAVASAGRAANDLRIVGVRFLDFSASTSDRAFTELPEHVHPKIHFTRPSIDVKDDLIAIVTDFGLSLLSGTADGEDQTRVVDLHVMTELVYSKRPGTEVSESDLEQFAIVNAPFNAWPYWREFTQSTLTRLGLPVFPLPLFHAADAHRLMQER